MTDNTSAKARQEGGSHYKDMAIQPIEFIQANGLGFCEGNVVKYVSRWRNKGGVEDLRKARHYIDLLLEHEAPPAALPAPALPENIAKAPDECPECLGRGGDAYRPCAHCCGTGRA